MPTAKKRINITVDDEMYRALESLSQKKQKSVSGTSIDLLEKAIELEEDVYFSRKSDERLSKKQKHIPHDKAWK
jgi:predicted DNA-binding protein